MPDDGKPGELPLGPRLAIAAVDKRVDAANERIDQLDEQAVTDRKNAAKFAEHVDKAFEKVLARQLSWPDLDQDERARRWPDLIVWLSETFSVRYPADAARIRPCWWRHPEAVDALTALWLCWCAAYRDTTQPIDSAAVWLTRWRPDLVDLAAQATDSCDPRPGADDPTGGCATRRDTLTTVDLAVGVPKQCPA